MITYWNRYSLEKRISLIHEWLFKAGYSHSLRSHSLSLFWSMTRIFFKKPSFQKESHTGATSKSSFVVAESMLTQQICTFVHVSYEIGSCRRELLKQRVRVTVEGHVLQAFSGSAGERRHDEQTWDRTSCFLHRCPVWNRGKRKLCGRTWSPCIRWGPCPAQVWTQWWPAPPIAPHSHFDRLLSTETYQLGVFQRLWRVQMYLYYSLFHIHTRGLSADRVRVIWTNAVFQKRGLWTIKG